MYICGTIYMSNHVINNVWNTKVRAPIGRASCNIPVGGDNWLEAMDDEIPAGNNGKSAPVLSQRLTHTCVESVQQAPSPYMQTFVHSTGYAKRAG